MESSEATRRRLLLALGSGTTLLAGCGDTDPTPQPAPPPETGTASPGPGPREESPPPPEETPMATEEIQQGTGTPLPDDVVFSKPGGGDVPATVYGSGACGIVLVPPANTGRQSWDRYARALSSEGYLAAAIDAGEERRDEAVVGAVDYLRNQRDAARVVVLGAGVGGEAAIRASVQATDAVVGLVALSPAGGTDVAGDLDVRSLFLVAVDDEASRRTAEDVVEAAPAPVELVTYPGDAHGQELLDSQQAEDVRTRIAEFLATVCTPATATPTPE